MATYSIKSRVFTSAGNPIFLLGGTLPLTTEYSKIDQSIKEHRLKGFRILKTPVVSDLEYKYGPKYKRVLDNICMTCEEAGMDVIIPITTKKEVEEKGESILSKVKEVAESLTQYVNITYSVDQFIPSFPVVLSIRDLISKILIEAHINYKDHSIIFPGIQGDIFAEYATRPTWLSAWAVGLSGDMDYLLSRYDKLGNNRPAKPIIGFQLDNTLEDTYELRKYLWTGVFNKMAGFIGNTHNKHFDGDYIDCLVTVSDLWNRLELSNPKDFSRQIVHHTFLANDIYATIDGKKTGITVYGYDRNKYSSILLNLSYLKYAAVSCREYDLISGKVVYEEHSIKRSEAFSYTPSKHYTKDFLVQFTV